MSELSEPGCTTAEALEAVERLAAVMRAVPISPALEARYAEIMQQESKR